jgi:hypothetical protein
MMARVLGPLPAQADSAMIKPIDRMLRIKELPRIFLMCRLQQTEITSTLQLYPHGMLDECNTAEAT